MLIYAVLVPGNGQTGDTELLIAEAHTNFHSGRCFIWSGRVPYLCLNHVKWLLALCFAHFVDVMYNFIDFWLKRSFLDCSLSGILKLLVSNWEIEVAQIQCFNWNIFDRLLNSESNIRMLYPYFSFFLLWPSTTIYFIYILRNFHQNFMLPLLTSYSIRSELLAFTSSWAAFTNSFSEINLCSPVFVTFYRCLHFVCECFSLIFCDHL